MHYRTEVILSNRGGSGRSPPVLQLLIAILSLGVKWGDEWKNKIKYCESSKSTKPPRELYECLV